VQWDPVSQIYIGGVIPEHSSQVRGLLSKASRPSGINSGSRDDNDENKCLRLFGYGSLCWNPGSGALAHTTVLKKPGRVRGYRRCWAQKSTDHRGVPSFPGIVCTLLKDRDEVRQVLGNGPISPAESEHKEERMSFTEGLIFEVPPDLIDECLAELDFREKGVSCENHGFFACEHGNKNIDCVSSRDRV
jgi:cation transport regulator ChaC